MFTSRRFSRTFLGTVAAVGLAVTLSSVAPASASTGKTSSPVSSSGHGNGSPAGLAPKVTHTGTAPTGYTVTFSYKDPKAKKVQIKGEWYFADPDKLQPYASTLATPVVTPGLTPGQWRPGYFPIASPNTTSANWPVVDMKKGKDGVWTYTTPLPSGAFNYGFFVDCDSATQTGCTEVSDPSNQPWNQHGTTVQGSLQATSNIYVPSDPKFGTQDASWLAPARKQGRLTDVTYTSPTSVTPAGKNYLAVYTPPGYDARRAAKYPTLYLSHGGGGNEADWENQGNVGAILDNLIATGQIRPMVVVMPNATTFTASTGNEAYDQNLINTVVPYVEKHYNVSPSASQRAFAGLSFGAGITNSLLFNHTDEFAYYGAFSRGPSYAIPTSDTLTDTQRAALKKLSGITVGGGWQDPLHEYSTDAVNLLVGAGVTVTPDFVPGGHEWYVWRTLLRDFLTRVAFFPPAQG